MYQQALKHGEPAYDPSGMWAELQLGQCADRAHPPPLAHERLARLVHGSGELARSVAEEMRKQPGFRDASTVLSDQGCRTNLELQRFVRAREEPANDDGMPPNAGTDLLGFPGLMVNFALHRSKVFWVDDSLAYMLAQTDLDVLGRELRVPFPSFALAFTDRHVLSLGERALSKDKACSLRGQILRVATVYVTEQVEGDRRQLHVCFAFDALGADLPVLVRHVLRLDEEGEVQACLARADNPVLVEPPVEDRSPMRGLLQVAVNAILYCTSAGVEPELRKPPTSSPKPTQSSRDPRPLFSSDEVYFLPGFIDISETRRLQQLERVQEGRQILRRFMVRGHWRRPASNWKDRGMRWIRPYWKGPNMAAIIERTYRLKP